MKRLRVILLFLLLGAIVNVAVAWGIALLLAITDIPNEAVSVTSRADNEIWVLDRFEAFGTHWYFSNRFKISLAITEEGSISGELVKPNWGSIDDTTHLYQTLPGPPEFAQESRMFEARGWPIRSLWCLRYIEVIDETGIIIKQYSPRGLIEIPFLLDKFYARWLSRGLPLYPIWPGFVVNTFFYVSLLWLLFPGPFALRRLIRHKRGLCVKCAYDLRGAEHEACPECGEELPPQ